MKSKLLNTAFAVAVGVAAGCGGGGSSNPTSAVGNVGGSQTNNSTEPNSSGGNVTNVGASTGLLTLEGTAATGAALASATISAKCASGSGSAISAANGTYRIEIPNGSLPCGLRASSTGATTVLHSAVEGSGDGKVIANISTFSELIVAQIHGSSATDFFDQFSNTKNKLTAASVIDAKAKVAQALASVVDLTNTDPIKDTLVAATSTTAGNSLDKKLDALRDKLATAKLTNDDLFKMFTANAGGSVGEVVKVLLQPQGEKCPGLRSGDYLYIEPSGTVPVQTQSFNAKTLLLGPDQYSLSPNCYLATQNGPKVAFGSQGIGIGVSAQSNLAVLLPKQALTLADLTGTWNYVERAKASGINSYKVSWGEFTVASDGKASVAKSCDTNGCITVSAANLTSFSTTSDGSFVAKDGMRAFGYRAATGVVSMIGIDKANGDAGRILIARKGPAAALPVALESRDNFDLKLTSTSQMDLIPNLVAYDLTLGGATNSYSRTRLADCQKETLLVGMPFAQMLERAAGSALDCVNNTINLTDLKVLSSTGLGFSATVAASSNLLNVIVTRD